MVGNDQEEAEVPDFFYKDVCMSCLSKFLFP